MIVVILLDWFNQATAAVVLDMILWSSPTRPSSIIMSNGFLPLTEHKNREALILSTGRL
jgi:hypothetical protein